jgi:superfamily II DNA or RNA helicase
MSIRVPIPEIRDHDMEEFDKHLVVKEMTKQTQKLLLRCPWITVPEHNTVRRDDYHAYLPFDWAMRYYRKQYRTGREECAPIKIGFTGTLRPEQQEIKRETLEILAKNGSAIMAVYPGGGKCLAPGTRVMLYDGGWRAVEELRIGDKLVGDDGAARTVLALGSGEGEMYRVGSVHHGFGFACNGDHILTLLDGTTGEPTDASVQECLRRGERLIGLYRGHDREDREAVLYRSVYLPEAGWYRTDKCTLRDVMAAGFRVERREDDRVYFSDPLDEVLHPFEMSIEPIGRGKYHGFVLDGNGRFLLWDGVVTHNTITSLSIASSIGMRTLILINKIVLQDQWLASIRAVFGEHARVQHLTSKNKIQSVQFLVMNALNVPKRPESFYRGLGIGLVIVDECHLIMSKVLSQALGYLTPRYLLGLSATPFRPDGFDSLLGLYFGLGRVVRRLHRRHLVYRFETGLKIIAQKDQRGKILWGSVIEQQTENEKRNGMVVDLCREFSERNILVLSKRVSQIRWLADALAAAGESVATLTDTDSSFDQDARILIATFQKVGTGFSHNKLDMLILATDTEEYFIQYLGRVFRTPDVEPIVIDMVDNNPILRKHYLTRQKVYEEAGGTIRPYPGRRPVAEKTAPVPEPTQERFLSQQK